jgi:cytochrome P450
VKLVGLPGPRGSLLGTNGNLMRLFRDPVRELLALRAHGEVVGLGRNDASVVCAFGEAQNRTLLTSPIFENAADIPIRLPADSAPVRLNRGLTSANGDAHKQARRALAPLFSRSAVERYRDAVLEEVALRPFVPGAAIEAVAAMTELSLAIAMRTLFGTTASPEMARLAVAYLAGIINPLAMMLPVSLPGTPYRRLLRVSAELEAYIRELIGRRSPGVLAQLQLPDDELVGHASVLFLAAFETTANTLAWTLLLLALHPREIPTDDAGIDAVIKESMRLLPATPMLFMRRATAPVTLGGFALPSGALVIASPLVTHRDPTLFPEPDTFRPSRWATLDPGPYQYLPFGAGPRMCLGAAFAQQTLRAALGQLLRTAHPTLAPNAVISRRVRGITLGFAHGLPLQLVEPGAAKPPAEIRGDVRELVAV